MTPIFFKNPQEFRKWLQKNHKKETELLVGFYKVNSGKPSMTWSQSVDQALCFGWIDGVRRSIDENSYQIRFTPRKPSSIWSAVNIQKIKELTTQGQMKPAGLAAFKRRKPEKSGYTHETINAQLPPAFEKEFKKKKQAWQYFQALAPSYRKLSIQWVMTAKQETTRKKRLNQLITDSGLGINQWKNNKYNNK